MTHINGSSADREKEMWELLLKQGSNVAKWRLHQATETLSFFVQIGTFCDKTHVRYPEMFRKTKKYEYEKWLWRTVSNAFYEWRQTR